jgi:hypothetical protein
MLANVLAITSLLVLARADTPKANEYASTDW